MVFGAYIVLSSGQAAESAASVEDLQRVETIKGLVFILATATFFCLGLFCLLRHIRSQQRALMAQRSALVRAEQRALAGMLASATAHDIKNILMYLVVQADAIDSGRVQADGSLAEGIRRAVDQLSAMADRLMAAGRQELPGQVERLDLGEVVRDWVAFVQRHADVRPHEVSTHVEVPITAEANASTIGRMVMNLVLNAAQARHEPGRIEVRLRREGDEAVLEVHDDGPGVPRDLRESIFAPFFSRREGGSGLGLLSVRACADEHGGRVDVGDSDLGGARFRVHLPIL